MEPEDRRDRGEPRYPDPRPLRRMQAATALLIAAVAVVTLLSGHRPAEVRWGTLAGLAVLAVVVLVVLRRRRREGA